VLTERTTNKNVAPDIVRYAQSGRNWPNFSYFISRSRKLGLGMRLAVTEVVFYDRVFRESESLEIG
jgi:hypothetical protein